MLSVWPGCWMSRACQLPRSQWKPGMQAKCTAVFRRLHSTRCQDLRPLSAEELQRAKAKARQLQDLRHVFLPLLLACCKLPCGRTRCRNMSQLPRLYKFNRSCPDAFLFASSGSHRLLRLLVKKLCLALQSTPTRRCRPADTATMGLNLQGAENGGREGEREREREDCSRPKPQAKQQTEKQWVDR